MDLQAPEYEYKTQEVKFVEWSKQARAEDYDVKYIINRLQESGPGEIKVLDVGGGIGSVGRVLVERLDNVSVDVVDNSVLAKENFIQHDRLKLIFDDFLNIESSQYDVIIFRTVLHHIISDTSNKTLQVQNQALEKARKLLADDGKLFVIENFYEPLVFKDVTGELIFQCTKLKALAGVFRSLGANTAGEGVRFRSYQSWMNMFRKNGLEMSGDMLMEEWNVQLPLWQRYPFLCKEKYQALVELKKA